MVGDTLFFHFLASLLGDALRLFFFIVVVVEALPLSSLFSLSISPTSNVSSPTVARARSMVKTLYPSKFSSPPLHCRIQWSSKPCVPSCTLAEAFRQSVEVNSTRYAVCTFSDCNVSRARIFHDISSPNLAGSDLRRPECRLHSWNFTKISYTLSPTERQLAVSPC